MDQSVVSLDRETALAYGPADHKAELRLWLRMLTCSKLIENGVRKRLRETFHVTLPRFDLMAQLDKAKAGLTLGELSRRMMVSNGNVTAIVEALVHQGYVDRQPAPQDRRIQQVTLTATGRESFQVMAAAHEIWIADAVGGLTDTEASMLMSLLARTKSMAKQAFDQGKSR